jgi:hypothetical protein
MTGIDEAAPVPTLLQRYGRSRATEAGIWLADRPAPLYQLLVLATLVQVVWPDAAPYCDHRVLGSAARSGCPVTAKLARLAGSPKELAGLSAALIRVSRGARAAREVTAASARTRAARTRAAGAAAS